MSKTRRAQDPIGNGISVALALSLPDMAEKPLILAVTYTVVVFTIVVQGLSLRALVERAVK